MGMEIQMIGILTQQLTQFLVTKWQLYLLEVTEITMIG